MNGRVKEIYIIYVVLSKRTFYILSYALIKYMHGLHMIYGAMIKIIKIIII